MAKDPAFLFYSSDFLTGITDLTMEERGQYITLLCAQHQKGELTSKSINILVGEVSKDVLSKFKKLKNGNFQNERLKIESEKRAAFTKSRRENAKKGGRPRKSDKPSAKPTQNLVDNHKDKLMENENENEIINRNEGEIGNLKEQNKKIFDNIISDQIWYEVAVLKNFQIKYEEFELLFVNFWEVKYSWRPNNQTDVNDIKIHFTNWLNSESKKLKNGKKGNFVEFAAEQLKNDPDFQSL